MARSDVLVSADWAESNLDAPNTVFVEVDEDASAYDVGHLAGAIKLDWKLDLQDPVKRDFVDAQQFSKLLSERGIANDDTVILYGGNNNWFAAYAYWYFKLYGHDKVQLIDGGRKKWELDGRPLSARGRRHPRRVLRAVPRQHLHLAPGSAAPTRRTPARPPRSSSPHCARTTTRRSSRGCPRWSAGSRPSARSR